MLERTQVLVLGLGGTISMRDASGAGAQPSLYLAEVLDGLPGELNVDLEDLKLVPGAALVFHVVLQVADRIRRAGAEGYVGAVVVQGTDTLEEVAYALHLLVDEPMTVVVTGAMRHGSSLGADGAANIAAAVATAAGTHGEGQQGDRAQGDDRANSQKSRHISLSLRSPRRGRRRGSPTAARQATTD